MRCVPTCPTWHRYFSSFLSWLNLTPAEHADWIKLPRQTVSPPPQISDLISSVFLSFSKEINGVRHPSVDTSEPQRRRHSSSNNKTFTLDNTSFTEKVFPYSAKKKEEEKDKQTRIMPQTWETYYPMYLWLLFSWVLWQPGEKNYPCDEVMTFTENIEPQEEWLRIYSSSSLKHFNQQLMI